MSEITPVTRKEQFYDRILQAAESGGGGGSTLIEKSISANGVYNASEDSADGYSKVTVNVPSGGENNAKFVSDNDFNMTLLESIEIPDGVINITNASFSSSSSWIKLKKIVIPSSVTSILAIAFNYRMPNLEEIIIHKPEGSISGAPWGATNATVTWTG